MNSLLVDVHVPFAIVDALRKLGVDVLTAQEDGAGRMTDTELLRRAAELNRVFLTQDVDFLAIASEWQRRLEPFPAVIFARQGVPYAEIITDVELLLTCCQQEELASNVYFLPLS